MNHFDYGVTVLVDPIIACKMSHNLLSSCNPPMDRLKKKNVESLLDDFLFNALGSTSDRFFFC